MLVGSLQWLLDLLLSQQAAGFGQREFEPLGGNHAQGSLQLELCDIERRPAAARHHEAQMTGRLVEQYFDKREAGRTRQEVNIIEKDDGMSAGFGGRRQ